jgi:hypothetical protein
VATASPLRSGKLVGEIVGDDLAEQLPLLALEAHHLQLLDRREIRCRRIDGDAG